MKPSPPLALWNPEMMALRVCSIIFGVMFSGAGLHRIVVGEVSHGHFSGWPSVVLGVVWILMGALHLHEARKSYRRWVAMGGGPLPGQEL